MKKFLTAALALSVIASAGVASAQPRSNDHYQSSQDRRDDRRDDRQDARQDRRDDRQDQWERRADRRYSAGRYNAPRGYKARHWGRGETLPSAYRGRGYVVSDYNRYHLAPPPRGYQYTRVGNDVVLTAVATGVIASVILDLFN